MTIKLIGDYSNRTAVETAVRLFYQSLESFANVEIYIEQQTGVAWLEAVIHRYLRAAGYDRYKIFIDHQSEPKTFSRVIQIQNEPSD